MEEKSDVQKTELSVEEENFPGSIIITTFSKRKGLGCWGLREEIQEKIEEKLSFVHPHK